MDRVPKHLMNLGSSGQDHSSPRKIKKIVIVAYHCAAIVSIGLVFSSVFNASRSSDRAIEAMKKINPGIAITSVKDRGSLTEITAKGRTIYATVDGKWFLFGQLFDGSNGARVVDEQEIRSASVQQPVAQAQKQTQQIPVDELGALASLAIPGGTKGAAKLFILSDPDCPFCKRLDGELKRLDGIETQTLLFPIEELHPGVSDKAAGIWCALDKSKALDDAFNGSGDVKPVNPDCDAKQALSTISAFADRHGFTGTPILMTEDGRVHQGYLTAQQIKQWLGL